MEPGGQRLVGAEELNADAGTHPVAQDRAELDAALRAVDRCWAATPYYAQRYGERGRRFGRSDTAWLASLASLTPQRCVAQVCWLAGLLAARGMPSLLLEAQVRTLLEELEVAAPQRRAAYAGLAAAADALADARRAHLDDARLDAFARAFDAGADPDWRARLPRSGALIACAVADERAGHSGAIDGLVSWLGDEQRFPPRWIGQVSRTLDEARAQVYGLGDSESAA